MKNLTILLFVFFSLTVSGVNNKIEKENTTSGEAKPVSWKLVWEDNFDTNGLPNSKIWDFETGYVRNKEEQFYTKNRSENARVENGNLVIEARKDNWEGEKITSASLTTSGKKNILYGKVEVRAKLPTGKGTWPAI